MENIDRRTGYPHKAGINSQREIERNVKSVSGKGKLRVPDRPRRARKKKGSKRRKRVPP